MNYLVERPGGRRRWIWLIAALAVGFQATALPAQEAVEKLLKGSVEKIGSEHKDVAQAIEVFSKGNFLEARKLLESAKQADPKIPPAGVLLAQLLYAANQPGLARNELEKVVKDQPDDPEAYLLFGEVGFQARRYADAELAFIKAAQLTRTFNENPIRQKSMTKRAYSGLAGVAEAREDWATAEKYLAPILQADPSDVNNTTRMARAIFSQAQDKQTAEKRADEEKAYGLLQKLWRANSSIRRPEITMGVLYENVGNRNLARSLMTKASERDTEGLSTQLTVARWAMEAGDLDLAQKCVDRATSVAPNSLDAKLVAGLVARYRKDYAAARRALESAHLQKPSDLAAMLQLAVVLAAQPGAEATALDYAQTAQRIHPDLSTPAGREAAVTLAWVYFLQGRTSEAIRLLQRALAGGGVSAESSYFAARVLHQQGNTDAAKKLLESALTNDRVFPAREDAEKLLNSLGGTLPQ